MASLPQPNKEPLGRLLIQFFHHYSRVFDFVKGVASVRCGRFLTKEQKRWTKKDPGLRGDRGSSPQRLPFMSRDQKLCFARRRGFGLSWPRRGGAA